MYKCNFNVHLEKYKVNFAEIPNKLIQISAIKKL